MWDEELSDEEAEKLLDSAAAKIKRRGMDVPAMLFLEMHKPLSYVSSQLAIVFSPFLVPFLGFDSMNNYSRLMSRRDSVDKLLQRLDKDPVGTTGTEG
jgi:hypothetical protein